jgi:type II secretory pathway component PulM
MISTAVILLLLAGLLWVLFQQQNCILMKISELTPALAAIESTLTKIQAEVQALKDAAADADLPPEVVASIDRLSALSAAIDSINPDGTTAPTEPLPPL